MPKAERDKGPQGRCGYLSREYAEAVAECGAAVHLERADGWIVQRTVPGSSYSDAMGCYPLFCCSDWSGLEDDLQSMAKDTVAISLVTDPFGSYTVDLLARCFPDRCLRFKDHYIVELAPAHMSALGSHHRRNVRKAAQRVDVSLGDPTQGALEAWIGLYDILIARHGICGPSAFSPASFAKQFAVPGLVIFQAMCGDSCVGMLLWYVQGNVGYYHLGAYSSIGYEARASYALFAYAIDHFRQRGLRFLNLGAGAGVSQADADGLSRFKAGWATASRPAYFCGRILNRGSYERLNAGKGMPVSNYFPHYRAGEFA